MTTGDRLASEIVDIISAADAEASKLVITNEEREAIKEQVIARSAPWKEISEEVFLAELDAQQRLYSAKPQGFVGLGRFVSSYLGSKGYSYASSHDMIKQLLNAGVIEVYYVPNPYGDERPTAAIRRSAIPPTLQAGSAQSDS